MVKSHEVEAESVSTVWPIKNKSLEFFYSKRAGWNSFQGCYDMALLFLANVQLLKLGLYQSRKEEKGRKRSEEEREKESGKPKYFDDLETVCILRWRFPG